MSARGCVWCLAVVFVAAQAACIVPLDMTRIGDPVPQPAGAPQNPCEEKAWLEVAPTSAFAYDQRGAMGYGSMTITTQSKGRTGLGVYEKGALTPLHSSEVFDRIEAEMLEEAHMGRIEPVERRFRTANTLLYTGLTAVLVGTVVFTAPLLSDGVNADDAPLTDTTDLLGGGLMIGGLVPMLVALIFLPQPHEMNNLNLRKHVFYKHEDDLDALNKGVSEYNVRVREGCR